MTATEWGFDVVGWLGAAALLAAYGLVSSGRVEGKGRRFQLLNLLGSAGLAANSGFHHAWPSVGLNLVWMIIGVAALTRQSRSLNGS
jgi:hypothetical protein